MNRDEIRKEFLDKMQLHISTTNLRNGKTWWDEYIDFLEEKVSKLHQPTVIKSVCDCEVKGSYEEWTVHICKKCDKEQI